MCAAILAVFITALVITVSYTVNQDYEDFNTTEASPSSSDLSPSTDLNLNTLLSLEWPLKDKKYSSWDDPPNATEIESAIAEGRKSLLAKETFEEKVPTLQLGSPSYKHQMATKTLPKARELSKTGHIMEAATKYLATQRSKSKTGKNIGRGPTMHLEWLPTEVCSKEAPSSCSSSPYRTADGSCNNLIHPRTWGVAMRPFRRALPPDYGDGISAPRKGKGGTHLPSARDVSLTVHRAFYRDDPNFTVMLAVWGQFIDHDITATALSQGKDGNSISCCNGYFQSGIKNHPECYTVSLESPDPYYTQYNVSCMEFVRAAPAPVCSFGPREQLNQATSFLDASVVYGTTDSVMNQLRTMQGGELKMLQTPEGLELLPVSTDVNDGCNQEEELKNGRYCFLSGDPRSNENIHLTTMHLLLARQHNLIVRQLAEINPSWDDEKLFQEGRKIVSAQIQHVTYNEFVDVILGPRLMQKVKMAPRKGAEYYQTYDPSLDPSIANSFASSAFRFGHTLLPGLVRMIAGDTSSPEYVEMHKMLFNPFQLYDKGFLEKAVRGAASTPVEKVDTYFNKEFTERLFERKSSVGRPKGMCGLDLVSLNVQRGRDHGLPGYPEWREHCGLKKPSSFADLEGQMDVESLDRIKEIYKSVDDIDMYTGALAELPLEGSLVGPTVTCLLTDQFLRLQRGDRFWYETSEQPQAFTPEQLKTIRETTLAKIICDTSGMEELQPYVMKGTSADNPKTPCSNLPSLNLSAWKDQTKVAVEPAGKIWLIKSSGSKTPSLIKLGGTVTSGSVTAEGTTIWSGAFPLRIPVKPLDGIADSTDATIVPYPPVFAHGILWSGNVDTTPGYAKVSGRFSLPQFLHGTENASIQWYNGLFSLNIQLDWNTTALDSIAVEGNFSTPLYFNSRWQFANLQNASVSDITPVYSPSLSPEIDSNANVSPLVLLGTFSKDGAYFLWSGNVTLVLPTPPPPTPAPADDASLLKLAFTPKNYVKRVKIGASVSGGSITVSGWSAWKGMLPLAIPVDPFDTLSESSVANDDSAVYYGHGINWKGSILSNGLKSATLSGSFSLPRFVHSNGIAPFSIEWYNGIASLDLDVLWSSNSDPVLSIDGTYTSPVYFGERWQYKYLKNVSSPSTIPDFNGYFSGTPKELHNGLNAPLVLLGTYTDDRKTFLWSGNITLTLPQIVAVPDPSSATTMISAKTSLNVPKERMPLRLVGGQVNVGGWNVWYNNLPLAFPLKPFDSVATVDNDLEPVDRPIVYGHGILWTGSATTLDNNYVKLKGTFSFPQFVHSNGLTSNFSLTWFNGDFDLQFQTNKTLLLNGTFTSPVYYAERPAFETLRDSTPGGFPSLRGLGIESTAIPKELNGDPENYITAPLILFGAYSLDRTQFLWSGDCILNAPQSSKQVIVLKATAPQAAPTGFRLGGNVTSAKIFVGDKQVVGVDKPPVTFPTDLFQSVSTSSSTANQPPSFAQEILWSGAFTNSPTNPKSVVLNGTFSLPVPAENSTITWYNGNFSFAIDVIWQTSNGTVGGAFSSPIYFQSRAEEKKNVTVKSSEAFYNSSDSPSLSPDTLGSAPIILAGTLSADEMSFSWSGGITFILPTAPSVSMVSEPPVTTVSRLSLAAFVQGGSIKLGDSTIWLGNRVPLSIPTEPFDSVVSTFDDSINLPPTYGHGISWKGFIASDAPGTMKVWGSYSLPQFLHGNGTKDFNINWYNGDFAFQLNLLWDTTTNVNINGTYSTKIYLQEHYYNTPLASAWELSPSTAAPVNSPNISPNDTSSFAPLVLWGNYSPDRSVFIWSGNVTLVVASDITG